MLKGSLKGNYIKLPNPQEDLACLGNYHKLFH